MSHGTYVNLELITMEIIEEQIKLMNARNYKELYEGEPDYDLEILLNNYKRGYIVVTMLISLIESFLNDILSQYIRYSSDRLLRCSIEEKIDILYTIRSKDPNNLRSSHLYGIFKEVNKIRNELIHYKGNHIGDSFKILSIRIGNLDLGEILIKSKMQYYLDNIKELINVFGEDLNLTINYKAHPIASDGISDNYRFAMIKDNQ